MINARYESTYRKINYTSDQDLFYFNTFFVCISEDRIRIPIKAMARIQIPTQVRDRIWIPAKSPPPLTT